MACHANQSLLQAYFDGELDAVRSVDFENHLKTCVVCAQELREQELLRQSWRSANLREHAPEALKAWIHTAIAGKAEVKAMPSRRSAAREWLPVAAAILIAFFLGAGMYSYVSGRHETNVLAQEIVAGHIRSLQPGHLMDVQSTDQHTVKPWFDGRVDFAPPVVDLKEQGFPLIGGRLDYVNGGDAAALVYQRQKHLINVFVWPQGTKPASSPGTVTIQGYYLIFWWRDGMSFCAASDLNTAELSQFAHLLEK